MSGSNPTNVAAGTYTVTVTSSGCSSTASVTLNTSSGITAAATPTQPTCGLSNGSISVTPTGGTYAWTGGLSGSNPTNVAAGTYTVTVTSGGCSSTTSVTLNASSGITAAATPTQPTCGLSNGSISVTPAGGTYAWTGGLSGSNPTNVAAGTYTVTVTSGGCSSTTSATVISASLPTVTINNIVNAVCNTGGSMKANPAGGTAPYTRLWSNGATTATISNLAGGTYTVTVTSANGCTATASATITNTAIAVPTGLTTTNITGTSVTLNWGAVVGAANYTILGRKVGSATWTTVGPVTGTSKNIQSQIACGKTYEWKVRANCADGVTFSAYSNTVNFTTSPCPSVASKTNAEWDGDFKTFGLSPNPANSLVTLYYSTETETPLNISIIDVTGRIVLQQNTLATQGDNTINLATNQLPQGYYVVEVKDDTTKMHEKLLISK